MRNSACTKVSRSFGSHAKRGSPVLRLPSRMFVETELLVVQRDQRIHLRGFAGWKKACCKPQVRSIVGKQLDLLVSNVGISKAATIRDHTIGDFDNLFAANVRSLFFLVQ